MINIFDTDSYKLSHNQQYPSDMKGMYSYISARGGLYPDTLFFGLQYILEMLAEGVDPQSIHMADELYKDHGVPFNKEMWLDMCKCYNGQFPIVIQAVPEGMVVPTGSVLVSVECLDPRFFKLIVSHIETKLLRVWYPSTVATVSHHVKKMLMPMQQMSCDKMDTLAFKLHDFGSRATSGFEQSSIGGCAHLTSFLGTDTTAALSLAKTIYDTDNAGFSIPAMEHSTVTSWGMINEEKAYENMVRQFAQPGKMFACVVDSYDTINAVRMWGSSHLREMVKNSGATVVLRPDSGDPLVLVPEILDMLAATYGYAVNTKGYRLLNSVRVIQGDGMNPNTIESLAQTVVKRGYSLDNVAFGMGGALLQKVNRDTQGFAMKCSAGLFDGKWVGVRKEPKTDPGKASLAGRVKLVHSDGKYVNVDMDADTLWRDKGEGVVMQTVFSNGAMFNKTTLKEVRERTKTW